METKNYEQELEEICIELYEIGALKFGEFQIKSGLKSPVYFDLRVIVSYPPLMERLANLLVEHIKLNRIEGTKICGVPYTALPFSTLVSVKRNIPMLIRRKEPKSYGTKKLIEGSYQPGEKCIIIEDVVTSGSSILETTKDLRNDGLVVSQVLVFIDREQGGAKNLEENGIQMFTLVTLSKLLEILHSKGKIQQSTVLSVKEYLKTNQVVLNGTPKKRREQMKFGERATADCECPFSRRLLQLMEKKRSNLCVAVDVPTSAELLELVRQVGEHCAVIKTHYDAVLDWSPETEAALKELAASLDFLIMEDRKYSDIGNTVKLQMEKVMSWADVVTLHSTPGPSILPAAPLPVFLLAQMSSAGCLINEQYTKATMEMAESYKGVVAGIVCKEGKYVKHPGFIHLLPGVGRKRGGDSLGQQYITPEEAVLDNGGDLIVVGRAIYATDKPNEAAKELREELWAAYEKRVSS